MYAIRSYYATTRHIKALEQSLQGNCRTQYQRTVHIGNVHALMHDAKHVGLHFDQIDTSA